MTYKSWSTNTLYKRVDCEFFVERDNFDTFQFGSFFSQSSKGFLGVAETSPIADSLFLLAFSSGIVLVHKKIVKMSKLASSKTVQ